MTRIAPYRETPAWRQQPVALSQRCRHTTYNLAYRAAVVAISMARKHLNTTTRRNVTATEAAAAPIRWQRSALVANSSNTNRAIYASNRAKRQQTHTNRLAWHILA